MPKIAANGIQIFYELHGSEDAPVLVLNNGILMNASGSWVFQTKALSRHYRLLLYDCRGQGQSDHPEDPYSMDLHAEDLSCLLDSLNIPSAHLLGISYGGEVAQAFALRFPERTRSLILADTASELGPELRLIGESWLEAARLADSDLFFSTTAPWNFSPAFIANNPELLADARKRYKLLDYPAICRLMECFMKVNFTTRLGEIKMPACIMVGEKDLFKGLPYAQILKSGIPQAELHILPGAGHASCWEAAAEFNSVVLGFLANLM